MKATWEVIQLNGEWYVHGPDDENHAGPFATREEAEEVMKSFVGD